MKKNTTLAAAVILSLGMAATGPSSFVWANDEHHHMSPAEMEKKMDKMAKDLSLTQDQKNQVRSIKEDKHRKMEDAEKESKDRIRAVLTPEQQAKFDKMMEEKHD
jgi:protein CpxP